MLSQLFVGDRDTDLIVSRRIEDTQGLRHGDKVGRIVEVEKGLAEGSGFEESSLPVDVELSTGGIDTGIDGQREIGTYRSQAVVGFRCSAFELLG